MKFEYHILRIYFFNKMQCVETLGTPHWCYEVAKMCIDMMDKDENSVYIIQIKEII